MLVSGDFSGCFSTFAPSAADEPEPVVLVEGPFARESRIDGEERGTVPVSVLVVRETAADESESTPISFTPLRRLQAAIVLGPVGPLELLGAEVPQRRAGPRPVVEALDAPEDPERRPLSALEGARVHAPGLDGPMSDSIAALSQGDDIEPIDGSIPASRMVFPSSSEAYRGPWSLRCAQPLPGLLRAMAIFCGA